jgi:hypothetical protein
MALMVIVSTCCSLAQADVPMVYQPVGFPEHYNDRIINRYANYPEGNNLILGGIPFTIPPGVNNIWWSGFAGGSAPQAIEITINLSFVREVHTLINTGWGATGGPYAYLEFLGAAGAYYRKDLYGNADMRDWYAGGYTNSINETTTINVFWQDNRRIDKQKISLPPEFFRQQLAIMRMVDNGSNGFQRTYLQGLTVGLGPPPMSGSIELLLLD